MAPNGLILSVILRLHEQEGGRFSLPPGSLGRERGARQQPPERPAERGLQRRHSPYSAIATKARRRNGMSAAVAMRQAAPWVIRMDSRHQGLEERHRRR